MTGDAKDRLRVVANDRTPLALASSSCSVARWGAALVPHGRRCHAGNADAFAGLAKKQRAAIAGDVATVERFLLDAASHVSALNGIIGTPSRRQASVVADVIGR